MLIVDDDEVYRELLKDAIEEEGDVKIELASDGREAMDKLNLASYDILITDLNMPHVDGLSLLRFARKKYPYLLGIVITGYGSLESATQAIREGAYDYIQKPFKIEEIKIPVRNAVDKVRIVREKTQLLEKLEAAYHQLRQFEQQALSTRGGPRPVQEEEAEQTYFLFPRHTVPFALFDGPRRNHPAYALKELERLRDLKQEGLVTEAEFQKLKRAVLQHLESDTK